MADTAWKFYHLPTASQRASDHICVKRPHPTVYNKGPVPKPTKLEEINIPDHLHFSCGEFFLMADFIYCSVDGKQQKLLLLSTSTTFNLQLLSACEYWLMDGTFHVVSTMMRQLYTITGNVGRSFFPLVCCLMSTKCKTGCMYL